MKTRSSAALLLCVGATTAFAAPAAQASTAAPDAPAAHATSRGLLDGLLGGLTGTTTTTTTTTAPITSTVTSLVDQLVSSGTTLGLDTTQLTNVVATVVDSGALGTVTDATLLSEIPILGDLVTGTVQTVTGGTLSGDLVGNLLGSGVALGTLPAVVDQLLSSAGAPTELVESLVGQVVGDILAVGLPTDASALDGLLGSLLGGAPLTGNLLEPVAGVLDALAANEALPADLRDVARTLAVTIRSTGSGLLPTDLVVRVGDLLGGVGSTANTSSPVRTALGSLSGLLRGYTGPASGLGRSAFRVTKEMRAKVRKVRVTKDRAKVRATIACPATALAGCYATSRLRHAGRSTGKSVTSILRPGQVTTLTFKVPAKVRGALRKRGGRIAVRVVSATQDGNVSASRSQAVKRLRAARR